jgi:hypothetical protein
MPYHLRCLVLLGVLLVSPARAGDDLSLPLGALFSAADSERPALLQAVAQTGDARATGALIQLLHWLDVPDQAPVTDVLAGLTGQHLQTWPDWMVWQQTHPEWPAWPGYADLLRSLLERIDPAFARFLPAGAAHSIRLEEIVWGGVKVDGIPALDQPRSIPAADALYLA